MIARRTTRALAALSLSALLLARSPQAQDAAASPTTATTTLATATPVPPDAARGFLQGLEEKNAATKSLRAKFTQLRIDESFLDEVRSSGEFIYLAPSRFRADYAGEGGKIASSTVFITGDKMYNYVPEQRQVDVVELPKGNSAAVHQLLLGFGVKVDKILEVFDVRQVREDVPPGKVRIEFASRDRKRTLNYAKVTITFDGIQQLPELLVLEDAESRTTISLSGIELNPALDEGLFVPTFPAGVDVIEHAGSTEEGVFE